MMVAHVSVEEEQGIQVCNRENGGESAPVPRNYRRGERPTWHQRRRHSTILRLVRDLPGRVLDFGCGYGDLSCAISKTHEVAGVDVDPDRIAFAQREYAPIPFQVCGGNDVPFPDESFDVVASVVVIGFVPDPVAHLRAARRVLRDGGHLVLACKNVDYVRNAFRRLRGHGPVESPLWTRKRSDVIALLHEEGFEVVRQSYFYDPPFSPWKNLADIAVGTVQLALSLLHVHETAGYFVLVARKVETSEPQTAGRH